MKFSYVSCLTTILLGLIILIYPDEGYPVVVKLNDAHGPSIPDLVGLVFIISGYSVFVYSLFKSREGRIYKKIFIRSNLVLIGVGLGLYFENEWILWSAVSIVVSVQTFVIFKLLNARSW